MTPREKIDAIVAPEALAKRTPRSQEWVRNFAASLRARRNLTGGQLALLDKVHAESLADAPAAPAAPKTVDVGSEGIDGVRALFRTMRDNGVAAPRMRLTFGGVRFKLTRAPDHGRNPGCIYVTDRDRQGDDGRDLYLGAIQATGGAFQPRRECTAAHVAALEAFGKNPAAVAGASGLASGECTFCHQELTDPRSKEVGYGPICAAKADLPWGADGSVPKGRSRRKAA